jgi:hypothetical protein
MFTQLENTIRPFPKNFRICGWHGAGSSSGGCPRGPAKDTAILKGRAPRRLTSQWQKWSRSLDHLDISWSLVTMPEISWRNPALTCDDLCSAPCDANESQPTKPRIIYHTISKAKHDFQPCRREAFQANQTTTSNLLYMQQTATTERWNLILKQYVHVCTLQGRLLTA